MEQRPTISIDSLLVMESDDPLAVNSTVVWPALEQRLQEMERRLAALEQTIQEQQVPQVG